MLTSPLLGGGYLRRPMSLTIGVVTLRALCQEWEEAGLSRHERHTTKKRGSRSFHCDSLLGGGYLRRPMSLTIAVVTLRALFQERDEAGHSRHERHTTKKREATSLLTSPLLGGGYLLSHFRSTIGVVRLNFSVRNGKRWDPHAMTT